MPTTNNTSVIILSARDNASRPIRTVADATRHLEQEIEGARTAFIGFGNQTDSISAALPKVASATDRIGVVSQKASQQIRSLGQSSNTTQKTLGILSSQTVGVNAATARLSAVSATASQSLERTGRSAQAAAASTGRMVSASVAVENATRKIAQSGRQAQASLNGLGAASTEAVGGLRTFAGQATAVQGATRRLEASVEAAENGLVGFGVTVGAASAAIPKFTAQTRRASVAQEELANATRRTRTAAAGLGPTLGRTANQVQTVGAKASVSSLYAGNLAAQFNDIGVTLAAGQSPFLVAIQQGTQITQVLYQMRGQVGVFRALGAAVGAFINPMTIATIGAIALGGVLINFARNAIAAANDSRDLTEVLESLEMNFTDYTGIVEQASKSNLELADTYGSLAQAASEVIDRQRELSQVDVVRNAQAIGSGLLNQITDTIIPLVNRSPISGLSNFLGIDENDLVGGIERRGAAVSGLVPTELGSQVQQIIQDIQTLGDGDDIGAIIDRVNALRAGLVDLLPPSSEWNEEQIQTIKNLDELEIGLLKYTAQVEDYQRSLENVVNFTPEGFSPGEIRFDDFADAAIRQIEERQRAEESVFSEAVRALESDTGRSSLLSQFLDQGPGDILFDDVVNLVDRQIYERGLEEHRNYIEQFNQESKNIDPVVVSFGFTLVDAPGGLGSEDPVENILAQIEERQNAAADAFEEQLRQQRNIRIDAPSIGGLDRQFNEDRLAGEREFSAQLQRLQEQRRAQAERNAEAQARLNERLRNERIRSVEQIETASISSTERIQRQIEQLNQVYADNDSFNPFDDELILSTEEYERRLYQLNDALLESSGYFDRLNESMDMHRQALEAIERRQAAFRDSVENALKTPIDRTRESIDELNRAFNEDIDFPVELYQQRLSQLNDELDRLQRADSANRAIDNLTRAMNEGEISAGQYRDQVEVLNNQIKNLDEGRVELTVESMRAIQQLEQFEKIWDNAVQNMQREFADTIYNALFEDGIESFSDFGDALLDIWKKALAEMIAAWVTSGFAQLLSGGGFGGFNLGNLFGGGGGGGFSLGSLFGGGGGSVVQDSAGSVLTGGGGGGIGGVIGSIGRTVVSQITGIGKSITSTISGLFGGGSTGASALAIGDSAGIAAGAGATGLGGGFTSGFAANQAAAGGAGVSGFSAALGPGVLAAAGAFVVANALKSVFGGPNARQLYAQESARLFKEATEVAGTDLNVLSTDAINQFVGANFDFAEATGDELQVLERLYEQLGAGAIRFNQTTQSADGIAYQRIEGDLHNVVGAYNFLIEKAGNYQELLNQIQTAAHQIDLQFETPYTPLAGSSRDTAEEFRERETRQREATQQIINTGEVQPIEPKFEVITQPGDRGETDTFRIRIEEEKTGGQEGGGRRLGGISEGPQTGFMELLHGREAIIPLASGDRLRANVILPNIAQQGGAGVDGDAVDLLREIRDGLVRLTTTQQSSTREQSSTQSQILAGIDSLISTSESGTNIIRRAVENQSLRRVDRAAV